MKMKGGSMPSPWTCLQSWHERLDLLISMSVSFSGLCLSLSCCSLYNRVQHGEVHRWSKTFGLQKRLSLFIGFSRSPVIGTIIVYWIRVYPDRILPETSLMGPLDALSEPRHDEPEFTPFDFTAIKLSHGVPYRTGYQGADKVQPAGAVSCSLSSSNSSGGILQRMSPPPPSPSKLTSWHMGGGASSGRGGGRGRVRVDDLSRVRVPLRPLCSPKWERDLAVL